MGKLIKKITILATLLTFALGTIVYADDEEEYVPYDIPDEEKDLALYCKDGDIDNDGVEDEWIVLRYKDGYDKYGFDYNLNVYYNNKPLSYYIDENYTVEVRSLYLSMTDSWKTLKSSDFYNSIIEISYALDFDNCFCQFRIKNNDTIISTSEYVSLRIDDSELTPVLSYNLEPFDTIIPNGGSSKITIKYNDNLIPDSSESPYLKTNIGYVVGNDSFIDPDYQFFTTNFKIDNHSEIINFNGINYNWDYCYVSFYCNFAHFTNKYDLGYFIRIKNVSAKNTNSIPYEIEYPSESQSGTPMQKEAVIKNHRTNLSLSESTTLNVDILSDEVSADDITFVSSDDMIASVDENGLVTANSVGTAYIYAESKTSDEVYDYCIINVYDSNVLVPVSSIKLNTDFVTLQPGDETKMTATVLPENSIDKSVVWSSSDVNVAYVSQDGTVTAVSEGECTITCTSLYDENITATVAVKVNSPAIKISKITVSGQKSVNAGKKFRLKTSISPENAIKTDLSYKSSSTKYATVNSKGVVTTKTAGAGKTVTITITANDGSNVSATYTFKINPIKVTRINLTASKTSVKAGAKLKINAIIMPSNATDKSVTFKLSNTKYATINSKGVLTAKKAGKGKKVKVTATVKDGNKVKGSITIKIK